MLGRVPSAFTLGANDAAGDEEPATMASGTEPTSVLAAAELLRVWVEELDRSEFATEAAAPFAPA